MPGQLTKSYSREGCGCGAGEAREWLFGSISKSDAKVLLFCEIRNSLSPELWYMSPNLL